MGNDAIGYFFIILLILIAAPLVFWIMSMLYVWIKWLFNDKKKLNESFSEVRDIENPIKGEYRIKYRLGTISKVEIAIADSSFNNIHNLFEDQQVEGKYTFNFDSKEIKNGVYYLVLKTVNQKITKKIVIEN